MLNRVVLIGRWSKEIDLRYTQAGKAVANTSIAVEDGYGDKKNTTFLNVVIWGKAAEATAQYSGKGKLVAIEGRITNRSYENNEGRKVYVTEIIADNVRFLESNRTSDAQTSSSRNADPFQDDGKPVDINDDDLPF